MIDDVNTRRHPPPPVLHFQHSAAHLDEPINFVLLLTILAIDCQYGLVGLFLTYTKKCYERNLLWPPFFHE